MSLIAKLLPKVLLFAVSALLSGFVASVLVSATANHAPVSSVGDAPAYLLAGPETPSGTNVPVAFNAVATGTPAPLPTLTPTQLQAAAKSLLRAKPVKWVNPTGFPRVAPITQFDGGTLQNYNCTLASGAMLARLATGIVTDGSALRSLQDKQVGGTSLNDLAQALWRGYGISYRYGLVRLTSLKALLRGGYGAVVQGVYGQVPAGLRLQRDFTGGHAIFLDGYYAGDAKHGIPEAYYVIDPLGRSWAGYEGDWWPAAAVDAFLAAFSGGERASAMWAYPPGGTPPAVVHPDVLPMPPDSPTTGRPSASPSGSVQPSSSGSVQPSASASVEPSASASLPPPPPPGSAPPWSGPYLAGETAAYSPVLQAIHDGQSGGISLVPFLDLCVLESRPAGCPVGLAATVILDLSPPAIPPPGPSVSVLFVDSPSSNMAIVGFTVDPPTTSDVRFWAVGVSPATVGTASAMTTAQVDGKTVTLARLDVAASTEYQFQVVAGSGTAAAVSPVGDFKTGAGVAQFDVTLGNASSPRLGFGTGLSPYLHVPADALVPPLVAAASPDPSCADAGTFGGRAFCLAPATVALASCPSARVTYALTGLDASAVVVRAYPQGGAGGVAGIVEAVGPTPSGTIGVGCLGSGLTYTIALYAQGNDQGVLAQRTLTVP